MADLNDMLEILKRADDLAEVLGWKHYDRLSLMMDIENFRELQAIDLAGLAKAKQGDFNHDIVGIWNHYDREAHAITGGFVARYAINQ